MSLGELSHCFLAIGAALLTPRYDALQAFQFGQGAFQRTRILKVSTITHLRHAVDAQVHASNRLFLHHWIGNLHRNLERYKPAATFFTHGRTQDMYPAGRQVTAFFQTQLSQAR